MAFSPPSSFASTQHQFLFQPPKSPASVATTPSFATATDYFGGPRKRQRPEQSQELPQSQPWTESPGWAQCPTPTDKIFGSAYGQSSALVNERYRLAGGLDTPSLQTATRLEALTVDEHEFRRRLRGEDMDNHGRGDYAPLSGPLARERNGVARLPAASPSENPQSSWTSIAFGLVGKAFNFGFSAVRGFYAGGGQGYDLKKYPLVGSDLLQESAHSCSTPIPGSWQADEFLGDFEQDSPSFPISQAADNRPPNKRRQTERDAWVMVGTPDLDAEAMSPKRKGSSHIGPRSNLALRPTASRASSRRSLAPVARRGNSFITTSGSPAQTPQAATQPQSHNRRASIAPTRSPQGRPSSTGTGTPFMSPEAERYAKRQAKQDKAISSMGKRMEEMIRQAQEALGTKVSVEGDLGAEDEGFVDDEW